MGFVLFTRRTDGRKLAWLRDQLTKAGIQHRGQGQSFHAPILEVEEGQLETAWAILTPVDDVPDDDIRFALYEVWDCDGCGAEGVDTRNVFSEDPWCNPHVFAHACRNCSDDDALSNASERANERFLSDFYGGS